MIPNDPLFSSQWHLKNNTPGLLDLNVIDVWDDYTGAGVKVGVMDGGFDTAHADLVYSAASFDFRDNNADVSPLNSTDNHGTATSGIIGATGNNNTGVIGAAFGVELTALATSNASHIDNAIVYAADQNLDVVNMSFGFTSTLFHFDTTTEANMLAAFAYAADHGRGGLGMNIVKSAGNNRENSGFGGAEQRDTSLTSFTNDSRSIVVAAVNQDGFISPYSTRGAALLVSGFGTPGEVVTTDRTGAAGYNSGANPDYAFNFNGTSSAAPMVTSVVALMLDANPNLGWRDVQSILANSARHVGTAVGGGFAGQENSGWYYGAGNTWNGGGLHYSTDYGYGLVDALAAVRLAETWQGPSGTTANQVTEGLDFGALSVVLDGANQTVSATETTGIDVERVRVTMTLDFGFLGDLELYLVSPTGDQVRLIADTGQFSGRPTGYSDSYSSAVKGPIDFDAQGFRGESSAGQWQVMIFDDAANGFSVSVTGITVSFFGTAASTNDTYIFTNEFSDTAPTSAAGDHSRAISDSDGGVDTLNASAVTLATTIDLTNGFGGSLIDGVAVTSISGIERFLLGDGNDLFLGDGSSSVIYGGRGADTMVGFGGNDTYLFDDHSKGSDDITESNLLASGGFDTIDASMVTTAVIINLLAGTATIGASPVLITVTATVSGIESLIGGTTGDSLTGDTVANTLAGGAGSDTLVGGDGNDTYVLAGEGSGVDTLTEAGAGGTGDTITSTISRTLDIAAYINIENLTLLGTAVSGTGNANANVLTGNAANNLLTSVGVAADTLRGMDGSDTYVMDTSINPLTDLIQEVAGAPAGTADLIKWTGANGQNYAMAANVELLTMFGAATTNATGNAVVNTIVGNGAVNILIGAGAAADTLRGMAGNDIYVMDTSIDLVQEAAGAGGGLADLIKWTGANSQTYAMAANVEQLVMLGAATANAVGNAVVNIITGTTGANILTGAGAAADTLRGGNGNDTYVMDTTTDTIQEAAGAAAGAADVIRWTGGNAQTYIMAANVEQLVMLGVASSNATGNAVVNTITGNAANNTLTAAGAGNVDILRGGAGNDTYVIDTSVDSVQEVVGTANGAVDHVQWTGVAGQTYVLAANVELLTLMGGAGTNGTGNAVVNTITGNGAANTLTAAGTGNADILKGLGGNDIYVIDTSIDTVQEVAGGGTADHVKWTGVAAQTYTLAAEVELLTLMGGAATNGTGNAVVNTITGNAAANILTAVGVGADTLVGLGGDDTYNLSATNHIITEALGAAGGLADNVNFNGLTGQLYLLAANVELLHLVGLAATNGTGNIIANAITGNGADNTLRGGGGNDILIGGSGLDVLFGDADNDTFRFNLIGDSAVGANQDVIKDFDDFGDDLIDLSNMPGVTAFIDSNPFTAAGQVRIEQQGANVLVQINTVGAGGAESEILIANATIGAGVGQVDLNDFML